MASRTRKAAAKSRPLFQITCPELPGSIFGSYDSFVENAPRALAERNAIADFRIDGDEGSLHAALADMDWDYQSIMAVVADPHADHVSCYYDMPLDLLAAA